MRSQKVRQPKAACRNTIALLTPRFFEPVILGERATMARRNGKEKRKIL
jgi:hypothetical protein